MAAWREPSVTGSWKKDLVSSARDVSWRKETEMTSAREDVDDALSAEKQTF
jgi:hypothetical protein